MSSAQHNGSSVSSDAVGGGSPGEPPPLEWIDSRNRPWNVEISSERIVLRSGSDTIDLPAASWSRDVYVTRHGDRFVIRFETFDVGAAFVLSGAQAAPLLAYVQEQAAPLQDTRARDGESAGNVPLLQPKVSPLAVWALITSSLVFVPVLGLVPAVVTVVLLILHRLKVRRARVWGHSRKLCAAAVLFLVLGMFVSFLATLGFVQNLRRIPPTPVFESTSEATSDKHDGVVAQSTGPDESGGWPWEREHNWGLLVAGLLVVVLSLSVHEAAHATSAWWLGDDFARRGGRVTLNPLAHIDPVGTVLLPLILFLAGAGVFGWARPVQVRTEVLDRPRRGHILISIAGPGSNLLLAAASLTLLLALGCGVGLLVPGAEAANFTRFDFTTGVEAAGFALAPVFGPLCTFLKLSFIINVFLAFFNLIPIPPLDGSWVLEHLFPRTLGPIYERIRPYGFLIFLLVLYAGLFQYLIFPALVVLAPGYLLLHSCTPF